MIKRMMKKVIAIICIVSLLITGVGPISTIDSAVANNNKQTYLVKLHNNTNVDTYTTKHGIKKISKGRTTGQKPLH